MFPSTVFRWLFIASLFILDAYLIKGDLLVAPSNTHALVGGTVVLHCEAAAFPSPSRITWNEFATNGNAQLISDDRTIAPANPNAARYKLIGVGLDFALEISDVQLSDGGKYVCTDAFALPGTQIRGFAELIVLEGNPICQDIISYDGNVIEGRDYTLNCFVNWRGNSSWAPTMSWSGPGVYQIFESITDTQVWSEVRFNADRAIEDGRWECLTGFTDFGGVNPPDHASNVPTYSYAYTSFPMVVVWAPTFLTLSPIKATYIIGDVLTCSGDSKPPSTYQWTNMRTLVAEPYGPTFTITPAYDDTNQTMRCESRTVLEEFPLYRNNFTNVLVPAITTTPVPTTPVPSTAPVANGNCNDVTGRWTSTNPNAVVCLEANQFGDLWILIRNGSDTNFVQGYGKVIYGDFKHVAFSGLWPVPRGAAGFVGECHNCYGTETILMSGLSRNFYAPSECGTSAGTDVTKLYVFTRSGPPCRGNELDIYNPNPRHLEAMGVRAKKSTV